MPTALTCTPTAHPDVLLLTPQPHRDARGYFFESYNATVFRGCTGISPSFIQDNQARSLGGVLRGLHYQRRHPQAKLVRVLSGRIWDVAVDLRRASPRFGQWVGVELSADNLQQLYVPEGFAHGYLVLSQEAEVFYKVTAPQVPDDECTLAWNDTTVGIEWPAVPWPVSMSARDASAPHWAGAVFF